MADPLLLVQFATSDNASATQPVQVALPLTHAALALPCALKKALKAAHKQQRRHYATAYSE